MGFSKPIMADEEDKMAGEKAGYRGPVLRRVTAYRQAGSASDPAGTCNEDVITPPPAPRSPTAGHWRSTSTNTHPHSYSPS